ncbi:MAG: glycosyltransferase [Candidatus Asgardarchaeia archaeon]
MKILVASIEAWRHPRAQKIASTLKNLGHDVEIWAAKTPKIRNRYLRALFKYLQAMVELIAQDADIYWIENVPDIIYVLLPFFRKKYIYDRRSPWALQVYMEFKNKILFKVADVIERFVMKNAKIITCVSRGLAEDLKGYNKKIFILPNYPDEKLKRLVLKDIRKELNVPKERKIVIFVGKISFVEGAPLLKDVAKELENTNAEFWIVGDGPSRKIVEEITKNFKNVRWFGWIKHQEVPNYIASANIGIVPRTGIPKKFRKYYSYEGIHKITEYFLFGLPVIACGIAHSDYYLLAPEKKFGEYVKKAVLGELHLPNPPELTWQKNCIPIIRDIITYLEGSKSPRGGNKD